VKIKIRPEQASLVQMNDWLAEFRDGDGAAPAGRDDAEPTGPCRAEPVGHGPGGPGYAVPASYSHAVPASPGYAVPASYSHAVPASPGHVGSASYVRPVQADPGYAMPVGHGSVEPVAGNARPEAPIGPVAPAKTVTLAIPTGPAATPAAAGRAEAAARAVIGDQLRMPIMWCEMGRCISWHADPAALGEADTRARAIAAGWRIDALGRLACPRCQQKDPGYWTACPVVPRGRYTAIARITQIHAAPRDGTAGPAGPHSSRAARGFPLLSRAELERHHDSPVGQAIPAGKYAANPAGSPIPTTRSSMWSEPCELTAAARQRLRRDSEHGEGLMIAARAHADPADSTTSTGRRW
jgi:hypothetical protein